RARGAYSSSINTWLKTCMSVDPLRRKIGYFSFLGCKVQSIGGSILPNFRSPTYLIVERNPTFERTPLSLRHRSFIIINLTFPFSSTHSADLYTFLVGADTMSPKQVHA